jgi:hypothetical protein
MSRAVESLPNLRLSNCSICNKRVDLQIALIDPDGNYVHEECYVRKLRRQGAKKPPKTS